MAEFEKLPGVKKGNLGEQIVEDFLSNRGLVVCANVTRRAHCFDKLFYRPNSGRRPVAAEVKTKARRTLYPDTGFDLRHYQQYKENQVLWDIKYLLFFVDEFRREIYGNYLDALDKPCQVLVRQKKKTLLLPYPLQQENKWGRTEIYFPLQKMIHIADLTLEQVEELKRRSNRKYKYPPAEQSELFGLEIDKDTVLTPNKRRGC